MSILTKAGKDAVDGLASAVEEIEEEVRERIEDAVNALDRYSPIPPVDDTSEATMHEESRGDYLDRAEVLAAIKRSAW